FAGTTTKPSINSAVTCFVYGSPTISPRHRGTGTVRAFPCCVSRSWPRLLPGSHPCIAVASTALEITELSWRADLHVAFTEDPGAATVRVQITENAEAADFAVVDGADAAEANACEANSAMQAVSISETVASGAPVIFLSNDGPADY